MKRSLGGKSLGLVGWMLAQVIPLLRLLLLMIGFGVVLAIARRRFHYAAWLVGTLVLVVGVLLVGGTYWATPASLAGQQSSVLWAGTLATAALSGFLVGRTGRRVGLWESYLAIAIVVGLTAVHLAKGWHVLMGIGPSDLATHYDFLAAPGERYLGPMWARVTFLLAVAGYLVAIFTGSLAFMFLGEAGKRGWGSSFEALVGLRHLTAQRQGLLSATAAVAILGIALGVAALVAVTAVMSGYQKDIQDKILSTNAHIMIQKYGVDFSEYEEVAQSALEVEGVTDATPFSFNEVMLSTAKQALGVLLKGIDPQTASKVTSVASNLCQRVTPQGICQVFAEGSAPAALEELLAPHDGAPAVIVGLDLFKRLKLPLGAPVTLTSPIHVAGFRGTAPRRMQFRLSGVFRSGMHEFDSRLIYLELGASQQLLGMGSTVSGVELRVKRPEHAGQLARKVLFAVGRYPYHSLDWRELNAGIFTALKLQKIVMFLVLAFIVVVAAFNIASTLFMAVVEKARDIGVLKATGARDTSIMRIFVLQGWIVGGLGTLVGTGFGLAVCAILSQIELQIAADVYMVESLRVRVQPLEVAITALATLVISHLATLYPALKAARQRPVDTLRYE